MLQLDVESKPIRVKTCISLFHKVVSFSDKQFQLVTIQPKIQVTQLL